MNETIQAPPPQEQVWGGQQPQPSGWSTKKTLAAVAVAAGIAVVGGGVIYAASQSTDSQSGFGPGGPGMSQNRSGSQNQGMQNGQSMQGSQTMPGMQSSGAMTGTPLHGEFVVSDNNGGYVTELSQTGTVTEISATSVTAKSDDDYTHTYTISNSTAASGVEVGDVVTIRATESGGTATVSAISEGNAGPGAGMAAPMDGQMSRPGN